MIIRVQGPVSSGGKPGHGVTPRIPRPSACLDRDVGVTLDAREFMHDCLPIQPTSHSTSSLASKSIMLLSATARRDHFGSVRFQR